MPLAPRVGGEVEAVPWPLGHQATNELIDALGDLGRELELGQRGVLVLFEELLVAGLYAERSRRLDELSTAAAGERATERLSSNRSCGAHADCWLLASPSTVAGWSVRVAGYLRLVDGAVAVEIPCLEVVRALE